MENKYNIVHRLRQWVMAMLSMRGHFVPFLMDYAEACGWKHTVSTVYETKWLVRRERRYEKVVFGVAGFDYTDGVVYLVHSPIPDGEGPYGFVG